MNHAKQIDNIRGVSNHSRLRTHTSSNLLPAWRLFRKHWGRWSEL